MATHGVTGDFCTRWNEREPTCEGPCFFVPILERVFGSLLPKENVASRAFLGEFVRSPLPKSPVRAAVIVFPPPGLDVLFGFCQRCAPMCVQAISLTDPQKMHF